MKKLIINLITLLVIVFLIIVLIYNIFLLKGILNSPKLYAEYLTPYPYWESKAEVLALWKKFSIISITFSSISFLCLFVLLVLNNLLNQDEIKRKKIVKAQSRIEKLQAELEELKKD